jgi:hypothetical protein
MDSDLINIRWYVVYGAYVALRVKSIAGILTTSNLSTNDLMNEIVLEASRVATAAEQAKRRIDDPNFGKTYNFRKPQKAIKKRAKLQRKRVQRRS